MELIKALIVEDEAQAIAALKSELHANCPDIKVCGIASTIPEALKLIEKLKPELIFLDIQLKDGTSFDLLEQLKYHDFKIIFTTAYSQYALKAIKISALDYLLKPIDSEELVLAVNKAKAVTIEHSKLKLESLVNNNRVHPLHKKLALQTSKGIFMYELETIVRLQSEGNYTRIYFKSGKKEIVAKILRDFEELLESLGFVRIHNSHIINLNHLESYINRDGGYVVLLDKTTLPVSKRKKKSLLALLNNDF
ncbi:LytR/AlgR family response regulator transcription factor [Winogradskyella flava]|uniref:Response regulator transcription factor n=1 Tax=Winogradskyella flava TaxID=1884876 RepID=A0A842IXC1_9FLAO|nr:LytTR family DNA-binding domain-containing protein [Winogradskyella flava]MBC2845428.1 response regulator transcription factor [Winogradskyella flava]